MRPPSIVASAIEAIDIHRIMNARTLELRLTTAS
jgi:hypothetical protein